MEETLERDIYHRLGGIEAKIDDFRTVRETANQANATAKQALTLGQRNETEIKDMRTETSNNRRWLIATIAGSALSMASVIVAIISLLIR
ncbi:hypothetical protein 8F11_78 [uncultured Caudovirales phage]|uniref:Uncharacterized protein n=1 Tax=uncultured Caudovirales phage TaxID=2100421 RepID=A0A2H4J2P0_9CAUD|nr:hypothetical protein 8F11_78 [uncultured Caudovirales phage]